MIRRFLPPLLSLAALLTLWQVAAMVAQSPALPEPLVVLRVMGREIASGRLPEHLGITLARLAVSFTVSMLLGTVILHYVLGPMLVAHGAVKVSETPDGPVTVLFRWGVWGGTALMVVSSLVSLAFQWRSIAAAFRRRSGTSAEDSAMAEIEVPGRWMVIAGAASTSRSGATFSRR